MTSPICPWCGDELLDDLDVLVFPDDGDVAMATCAGCGGSVRVHREVLVILTARKAE